MGCARIHQGLREEAAASDIRVTAVFPAASTRRSGRRRRRSPADVGHFLSAAEVAEAVVALARMDDRGCRRSSSCARCTIGILELESRMHHEGHGRMEDFLLSRVGDFSRAGAVPSDVHHPVSALGAEVDDDEQVDGGRGGGLPPSSAAPSGRRADRRHAPASPVASAGQRPSPGRRTDLILVPSRPWISGKNRNEFFESDFALLAQPGPVLWSCWEA